MAGEALRRRVRGAAGLARDAAAPGSSAERSANGRGGVRRECAVVENASANDDARPRPENTSVRSGPSSRRSGSRSGPRSRARGRGAARGRRPDGDPREAPRRRASRRLLQARHERRRTSAATSSDASTSDRIRLPATSTNASDKIPHDARRTRRIATRRRHPPSRARARPARSRTTPAGRAGGSISAAPSSSPGAGVFGSLGGRAGRGVASRGDGGGCVRVLLRQPVVRRRRRARRRGRVWRSPAPRERGR